MLLTGGELVTLTLVVDQKKQEVSAQEGWEYAAPFTTTFHATERTVDIIRRRRWHRKMICEDESDVQLPTSSCTFSMSSKKKVKIYQCNPMNISPSDFSPWTIPLDYGVPIYDCHDLVKLNNTLGKGQCLLEQTYLYEDFHGVHQKLFQSFILCYYDIVLWKNFQSDRLKMFASGYVKRRKVFFGFPVSLACYCNYDCQF